MKILIVEDDPDIAELLLYNLGQEGWTCEHAANGSAGLEHVKVFSPDLILLDLMLPDVSGLDICRTVKSDSQTKNIPIIMLTAKSEEIDRIVGFELGADDYVTKPFSYRELILRIKAIGRRTSKAAAEPADEVIEFGVLKIDLAKYEVKVNAHPIQLTSLEFKILNYLIKMKGRVATREMLLDKVWGYNSILTTRTVDTHIKRLREKIETAGEYIETVRGVGYRFKEAP